LAWWRHSAAAASAALLAPVLGIALIARPSLREGLGERLGGVAAPGAGAGRPVWIHGASIGEAGAALRLLARLGEAGRPTFASASTPSGRALLEAAAGLGGCAVAPLDHPWCVARALARVDPLALVLVETELWPSWIAAAKRRGVPVAVVSGRISDRSFPRYLRLRPWLRHTLARLDAVGARTELDAERFVALGADPDRVRVTGDLKLEPDLAPPKAAAELVRILEGTPFFVAGSTHPGEEEVVLDAFTQAEAAGLESALVLAPRHPDRAAAVARLAASQGRRVRMRSELSGPGAPLLARGEVVVLDTLGELPALYGLAWVAFVGGSLVPLGGHNLLEPIVVGCPLLHGPHDSNVAVVAKIVEECGAGRVVADAGAFASALLEIDAQGERFHAAAAQASQQVALHRGATERSAALVEALLGASDPFARPAGGA